MPEGDGDIVNDFGVGGDILTEISAIPRVMAVTNFPSS